MEPVLNSAKAIGCGVVNVGAKHLIEENLLLDEGGHLKIGEYWIQMLYEQIDPFQDYCQRNDEAAIMANALYEEDNLNNRFKPIQDLRTDAIFSVDDDVVVLCPTLDFAFTVWQSASDTMHWLDEEKDGVAYYSYGGWWSVWWMGTYSMVLSKAAFFHQKYLDLYTFKMPSSIHDYVTKERNCEDIAMSLLVANATGAPPIWVKGKIHEIGASGISSLQGHSNRRNKCLNDFISLYGNMPLISTNVKAVDAAHEWFW